MLIWTKGARRIDSQKTMSRNATFKSFVSPLATLYSVVHVQKRSLVNVKLKWVKDSVLDSVVSRDVQLKATCTIVSLIGCQPSCSLPVHRIIKYRGQLGLPSDLKISSFLRRYPNIFEEFYRPDSRGTPVPFYKLTSEALEVYRQEMHIVFVDCYVDILNKLQKLLMLTKDRFLPLQSIDQIRWELGLPYNYIDKILEKHADLFSIVELPDGRLGLKLLKWDDSLAVSVLECKTSNFGDNNGAIAFPIVFTRGFGLKRKCMEWLYEWQTLPYTSPYVDASHLDPRTDVSEKRIVGVFHELLHLTILQKVERKNVSNLRKPLSLPYKFTKVFERHPGVFYISMKGDTQTVVLREAYDHGRLIEKHPIADIWDKYATMMKRGFLDRSKGLYKRELNHCKDELRRPVTMLSKYNCEYESETDMECNLLSDYESDEECND